MGKLFDNSGKNTENEIYDTSHRQYWAPPGYVAYKDNLGTFLCIVLAILLVGAIDVFLLHPISTNVVDDLSDSGTPYEQAALISTAPGVFSHKKEVLLVEMNGEIHLLMFDYTMFDRLRLQEDILIEETGSTQTIRIGPWPFFADITIDENNQITDADIYGSLIPQGNECANLAYILIGISLFFILSYLYQHFTDRSKKM